ncbi:MAG: acylphosphatase [Bacteroidia bacterium]
MRWRLRVYGKVQGVFFRQATLAKAQELGLRGFVRNMSDGSVLIEAQGAQDALEALFQWAHHGPPAARVTRVHVEKKLPPGNESSFQIVY